MMVVTLLGQQYINNVREKPTILYTCTDHHVGTPDINKAKAINVVLYIIK